MSAFFALLTALELQQKLAKAARRTPSISGFPRGLWRIDWIGDLAFPDRTIRRRQSSVFVHLSRLSSESVLDDPNLLLNADCTVHTRFQKKVWVSVGALSLLRVGDIWRDGKLEEEPDYELETFSDVQIDNSKWSLIKAGLKIDDSGGYLLPLAEHPWHVNCTQSYCIMVRLSEDRRLVIPCMELVRFYFGSSSELLARLFLPGLKRESLYTKAIFHRDSGHLTLELAEGIFGTSAADIGRLSLSGHAWRAAIRVNTSTLASSVAGRPIYPQALFPFEGMSTLIASGKWLTFAGKPQSTFLVYRLRSCSHPFPFRTLKYEAKSTRARSSVPQGSSAEAGVKAQGSSRGSPETLVEKDASNSLAKKSRTIQYESKFPDLVPKIIWKAQSLASGESSYAKTTEVDQTAVGEGGSERRVRSVDLLVMNGQPGPRRRPEFLRLCIEETLLMKDFNVELLTSSDHDGWTVPVSLVADEDGELDSKLFFEKIAGKPTLRRACILAFRKAQTDIFAVIIESSAPCTRLYPSAGHGEDQLWQTLARATADFLEGPETGNLTLSQKVDRAFEKASVKVP